MATTQSANDRGASAADGARPHLCVMAPAFNEEKNLRDFHREVSAALHDVPVDYSFLFVDDGSEDGTSAVLEALHREDSRVGFVRFARNFGLQAALAAGLRHSVGDAVVVMDADLQDDPESLREFVREWRAGAQVVYAIRTRRKEWFLKRWAFSAFHWLMAALADIEIPRDAGAFALYDRRVVDLINSMPERNRYLPGLRAWIGFRQIGIPVERRARRAGEPGQSLRRLIGLALDGLLSFSKLPLRLASYVGFAVTAMSFLALLVVLYWRFVQRSFPSGVGLATIALSLLFVGGTQLLMLGIIGEYLGRVYDEVKQRPHFVVAYTRGPVADSADSIARRRTEDASVPATWSAR
jgi:glycosyltransferase involved in cell wall biosynthesis